MTNNCIKIDYLTISCLPGSSKDSREALVQKALYALGIDQLQSCFEFMCTNYRYEMILRYQNISIKIPSEKRFANTGVCFEFTGSGFDYYENYLAMNKRTDIHSALNRFRLLYLDGYKTKCSRFDIAIDDKCFGEDKPLLNLDIIEGVLKSHCFVSHFRRSDPKRESGELVPIFKVPAPSTYDDSLPFDIIESMNLSTCRVGKTIYLGKEHSSRSVRIYDKMAEQEVKGAKLPEDLKHWVRFEIELHDNNAGAAFSKFLDCKDPTDFSKYVSRVSYDLIRFVDKDHSRRYNCTVCDWWLKFLGCLSDKGMYINKLSTNQYLRSKRYFNQCLSAILSRLFLVDPLQFVQGLKDGMSKLSKTADRIKADYYAYQGLSPGDKKAAVEEVYRSVSGEDYWRMFADQTEGDFDERMLKLFEQVAY